MGGTADSSPATARDAAKTPITAGGFVDSGPAVFEDITKAAGLSGWSHKMGTQEKKLIIETNGSGVGLIDYDNDGWLDIYVVSGSTFDALDGKETPPHAALFHNNHDGTFTDVAAKAGVTNDRWGFGVAIAAWRNVAVGGAEGSWRGRQGFHQLFFAHPVPAGDAFFSCHLGKFFFGIAQQLFGCHAAQLRRPATLRPWF